MITEPSSDTKLETIGGKVKHESGTPLTNLLLALKIIWMYLFTNLTADVLNGHITVLTLSSKLKVLKLGTTLSIIAKKHLYWLEKVGHLKRCISSSILLGESEQSVKGQY